MKFTVRRGFTVVEALIVMALISVLAAAAMLSMSSATTTAKANNIINNLLNIKMAAHKFMYDSADVLSRMTNENISSLFSSGYNKMKVDVSYLIKHYANTREKVIDTSNYSLRIDDSGRWYITCEIDDPDVKSKLAGRAKAAGLLNGSNITAQYTGGDSAAVEVLSSGAK